MQGSLRDALLIFKESFDIYILNLSLRKKKGGHMKIFIRENKELQETEVKE